MCNHPNLLRFIDSCEDKAKGIFWIITEYYRGGNLKSVIHKQELTDNNIICLASEIAAGLVYLHESNKDYEVLHKDLKPQNVLVGDQFCVLSNMH
jgi:serine/threonine protein kinase